MPNNKLVTYDDVIANPEVQAIIEMGNEHLGVLGYTEHGFRHAELVARNAGRILTVLGYTKRKAELAAIAGYVHDIGNVVSRHDHGKTGALMLFRILQDMGMPVAETATVAAAVGNHEEEYGQPVNQVTAALILADKTDVHRQRVRNPDVATFDIHDRVNYASHNSTLLIDGERRVVTLDLIIDTKICPLMDYFEIFLARMVMCRRAADFLDSYFSLVINDTKIL